MTQNILFTWDVLLSQSFALPLDSDLLHPWVSIKLPGNLLSGLSKISPGSGNKATGPFAKSHFKIQRMSL